MVFHAFRIFFTGDVQMTAMGVLGSISCMSNSQIKPLENLSGMKPLTSMFYQSLFVRLLLQFSVHLIIMVVAVRSAKMYLPPDYKVDLDGEFNPGIVNSVAFLVSNVQQVPVFVVNLHSRPFMNGLTENRPLLWSLVSTFILTFMFASESVPSLNKYFQLVPFPDEAFRNFILTILVADVILSLIFDRLMKLIFCPKILYASVEGTTLSDVFGLLRTVVVILLLMIVLLGNDETWEEMLEEIENLQGLGNVSASGSTNGSVGENFLHFAQECVGAACTGPEDGLLANSDFDEF